ncbi:MAG: hydroxymethylglutaryl-CoA lyase [Saprospiraceae bacterium]|nr:hydroxymethylglutaryl-CoA lyase [Saprospiraceae bacterium]
MNTVKIVECPRDAMQGLKAFIPTDLKVRYINQLLKVGFHTVDFGSFVSPKAIPQMRDTAQVLANLDRTNSDTKLLAIVANRRGAKDAVQYTEIDLLGFPFSVSETFQLRNTNATIGESLERLKQIQEICLKHNKVLVVYLSMGFGNPYGDPWNVETVQKWVDILADLDIKIMALSDTIGVSTPESIHYLFSNLIPPYPDVEFGAHLHTTPGSWQEKIQAAYESGCLRYDGALKGFGGCPMAKDELTGNMPTENLVQYFDQQGIKLDISRTHLASSLSLASVVFAGNL